MIEFVLQQLGLRCEILNIAADQLTQTQVLVQSGIRLIFALQDVTKARAEPDFTATIEDNL